MISSFSCCNSSRAFSFSAAIHAAHPTAVLPAIIADVLTVVVPKLPYQVVEFRCWLYRNAALFLFPVVVDVDHAYCAGETSRIAMLLMMRRIGTSVVLGRLSANAIRKGAEVTLQKTNADFGLRGYYNSERQTLRWREGIENLPRIHHAVLCSLGKLRLESRDTVRQRSRNSTG